MSLPHFSHLISGNVTPVDRAEIKAPLIRHLSLQLI